MKCLNCGDNVDYCGIGRPPKYCKSCAYFVDLKQGKTRQIQYRQYNAELGTRNTGSSMKKHKDGTPNFKAESREIKKELRELGVKSHGHSRKIKK